MRKAILSGILAATVAIPGAALADSDWDDRPVTSKERAKVLAAIRAIGCDNPSEIERDDDGYEADNATCADGVFDIDLDRQFRVIDRDRED